MMLTVYEFAVILMESIGVMIIDKKKLPFYLIVVIITIIMFYFYPRTV